MAVIDSITDVSTARIIRVLISGTTLRVTVQDQLGEEFTTSVGIPQGDGLSPVLLHHLPRSRHAGGAHS